MEMPAGVAAVVAWLRKGYPEGLPVGDYVPLFAILARRLSEEEVNEVAEQLAADSGPSTRVAISEAIMGVTYELPSDADIARVTARLIEGGCPVETPPDPRPL
jgi:hypothetical protein